MNKPHHDPQDEPITPREWFIEVAIWAAGWVVAGLGAGLGLGFAVFLMSKAWL